MIVTTEAKLKDKAFNACLEERSKEESRIILYTYQQLKRHDFEEVYGSTSKLNSHISKKFDILTREANSTICLVSGAIESYLALKEFELKEKKERLGGVRGKLRKRKTERTALKQKAAENRISRRGLRRLKNVKHSVYRLQNKANELKQDIKKLKRIIKNEDLTNCKLHL